MTPLLLFLLGCAVTYLGTVSAAFNALMRLSLRIHAERSDRDAEIALRAGRGGLGDPGAEPAGHWAGGIRSGDTNA